MSGLVTYDSSDEDDVPGEAEDKIVRGSGIGSDSQADNKKENTDLRQRSQKHPDDLETNAEARTNGNGSLQREFETKISASTIAPNAPVLGPTLGPQQSESDFPLDDSEEPQSSAPLSPYSASRALLRQYTLPALPNLDIPDSPPGSPAESTNKKFAHFLELKQQGIHFNEKLAKSSALKNPSLMQKLMDFSDIDELGQYASTLPNDLWDPANFPEWAYKENLASRQQQMLKKIEEEKSKTPRDVIDFVPATNSGESSRSGTPGTSGISRTNQKSAAERVMAGLDRRSNSPQVTGSLKRKSRFDT